MKKKRNKPEIVYRFRRGMTQLYIVISFVSGMFLSLAGTGLDGTSDNPNLYWIGMIILISSVSILSIYTSVIGEKIRENEIKISNKSRRNY